VVLNGFARICVPKNLANIATVKQHFAVHYGSPDRVAFEGEFEWDEVFGGNLLRPTIWYRQVLRRVGMTSLTIHSQGAVRALLDSERTVTIRLIFIAIPSQRR
jgi:hypothetical protein